MEQNIARQNSAAKPATGKTFLLGIAGIIIKLSIAQVAVNFLITITGLGLLNLLFYLYAVVLLISFMTRTVAGNIYILKQESLILQRMLGDSTVLGMEIPLDKIVSIRPFACGQRLNLDYRQVTYVDTNCAPGLRMRLAFDVSLVWTWLARVIAGKQAYRENGTVIVYMEGGKRCACAIRPDAEFRAALEETLPEAYGADERLARAPLHGYWAMSLRRTFEQLYPHVCSAVTQEEEAFEREQAALREEEKIEKTAKKKDIPVEQVRKQRSEKARKKAAAARKRAKFFASLADKLTFLAPVKRFFAGLAEKLSEEETELQDSDEASPRRRRGRQE
ncbi:MAG: hypothetical protein IKU34_11680 [Clostridia bacterium]|nr:hypothetical protein [Clostridia bacterium]